MMPTAKYLRSDLEESSQPDVRGGVQSSVRIHALDLHGREPAWNSQEGGCF